jgi:hypothetical protein
MAVINLINQNKTDIDIANKLLANFTIKRLGDEQTSGLYSSSIYNRTMAASSDWSKLKSNLAKLAKHQQSSWDAYTSMVQYNVPLPSMEEDLEVFKPLGVTAKVSRRRPTQ